jgi:hypothetical protein
LSGIKASQGYLTKDTRASWAAPQAGAGAGHWAADIRRRACWGKRGPCTAPWPAPGRSGAGPGHAHAKAHGPPLAGWRVCRLGSLRKSAWKKALSEKTVAQTFLKIGRRHSHSPEQQLVITNSNFDMTPFVAICVVFAAASVSANEADASVDMGTLNGLTRKVFTSSDGLSTTTCSHTKCVMTPYHEIDRDGNQINTSPGHKLVKVLHHNAEHYGNKHVCFVDMHIKGKCGCECFDEAFGLFPLTNALAGHHIAETSL